MRVIAAIPARFDATRFPGKLLEKLGDKSILQHVYENVVSTNLFDEVIIATDDFRIKEHADSFHAKVVMTSSEHQSGSDRIAEAVDSIPCDIVVNVQGDEPFISKEPLRLLIESFADSSVQISTLITDLSSLSANNPNVVKVVIDKNQNALYFSRSVIPFNRDSSKEISYFQHIGVYGYRKDFLKHFVTLPQSYLEKTEKLEQLRILENGYSIRTVKTSYEGFGIDTKDDLEKAEILWKEKK
jgi:3-deoxy-manno-octulosonate cytidylyltransferase (CMP-KDO synthetase)